MPTFSRLLLPITLAYAALAALSGRDDPIPPSVGPDLSSFRPLPKKNSVITDATKIASTVQIIDQKRGANSNAAPGLPASKTVVTAVDGQPIAGFSSVVNSTTTLAKRAHSLYDQVFAGTGTALTDRDGAIMGTAYLTYTVVPNSTYNVDACLDFCDSVPGCVFANLYYEFNNELLDFVFSEKSNLKCAVYADIHTAAEKTNMGGQQSESPPAGLTYIQQSSGYASQSLTSPPDPDGYELTFGPLNGANNAPGYMGFAFIDRYDVSACAALCNTRGADPAGGACQFFNIWRAVVNGIPTTYTCSMYYIPAGADTAVNTGQGDLKVTLSRGYTRKSALADPGFEAYAACEGFCFTGASTSWIGSSPSGGFLDASIFHYQPYAHSGNSVGLFGSATGHDALPGTLTPVGHINTTAGRKYTVSFFLSNNFAGAELEAPAFVELIWNGQVVTTIRDGYSPWKYHSFDVVAVGGDTIAFRGGQAPAWTFIDDVYIFQTDV